MFHILRKYFSNHSGAVLHKPLKHLFLKDDGIANSIHDNGYYIADFLGEKEIQLLTELYKKYHKIEDAEGGIFISTFSKDIEYRKIIHTSINGILENSFKKWFQHYKNDINTFAIKTPGKSSHFIIHQDVAAIDEEKYSLLNIWAPLQDITSSNGALCVVPRSHHIFSPYRCPTVDSLIKNVGKEIYRDAIPIYLKLGQALFFDPRVFHFSEPNVSNQNRVVVQCRICPFESDVVIYFNEKEGSEMRVEMWQCPDDYFVNSDAYADNIRPENCKLLGYRVNPKPLTLAEFEKKKREFEIMPQKYFTLIYEKQRNFIREPVNNKFDLL